MSKFVPVTDAALEEVLRYSTKGPWGLASTDKNDFYIYRVGSDPIRRVVEEFPYGTNGYDMRLMSLAYELGLEVLALRKRVRYES